MNNFLKYSLIGLPILVGGYIVYKQLKPKKKKEETPTPPTTPTYTPSTPSSGSSTKSDVLKVRDAFPLKKGSKGQKVTELQNAILISGNPDAVKELGKSGADGVFGSGTERAVKLLLGKTSVDNQSEIEKIKTLVSTAQKQKEGTQNRINIAKNLVALFNKGRKDFYAINDIQIAKGSRTSDGRDYDRVSSVLKKGQRLSIPFGANFFVDNQGFIRVTTSDKFWEFSPYGMQVK